MLWLQPDLGMGLLIRFLELAIQYGLFILEIITLSLFVYHILLL